MKKLFLIASLFFSSSLFGQDCITVKGVENKTENPDLSSKRFIFGVKQIAEELLSEKYTICLEGRPVNVFITNIEAPSQGISIGPFMIKKKITIVTTELEIDGNKYKGEGKAAISVKTTFAELRDENLPFEKSVFASAVKKAIEDSISKI
jgi:hypothetical protein